MGVPKEKPHEFSAGKQAEAALREREDLYRDLVEHSQDLLCTHDLAGRLLSINPLPARLLGYEVEALLQMPMRELLAPEYRDQFEEYLDRIQRDGFAEGSMVLMARSGEQRIWEYYNTLRTDGFPHPSCEAWPTTLRSADGQKLLCKRVKNVSELTEEFPRCRLQPGSGTEVHVDQCSRPWLGATGVPRPNGRRNHRRRRWRSADGDQTGSFTERRGCSDRSERLFPRRKALL